jgi:hypothetical protein
MADEDNTLLETLRKARPRWQEEGGGVRPPQRQPAEPRPGPEFPASRVTRRPIEPQFPEASETAATNQTADDTKVADFPFRCDHGSTPGTVTFFPGQIGNVTPTVYGVTLVAGADAPDYFPDAGDSEVYIKVDIDTGTDNIYKVASASIDSKTNFGFTVDEMKMDWDDSTHNTGSFYIHLADFTKTTVGDTVSVKITQRLFVSLYSIGIVGDTVILMG